MVCYIGKPSTKGTRGLRTSYPNTDGLIGQKGYLTANGSPGTAYANQVYLIDRGYTSYFSTTDYNYAVDLWSAGKIGNIEIMALGALYTLYGSGTIKYRDDNTQTGHAENLVAQEGTIYPKRLRKGINE